MNTRYQLKKKKVFPIETGERINLYLNYLLNFVDLDWKMEE